MKLKRPRGDFCFVVNLFSFEPAHIFQVVDKVQGTPMINVKLSQTVVTKLVVDKLVVTKLVVTKLEGGACRKASLTKLVVTKLVVTKLVVDKLVVTKLVGGACRKASLVERDSNVKVNQTVLDRL